MENRVEVQQFCVAEELLANKRFQEALQILNKCHLDSLSEFNKAYFCLLMAEIKLYLGDFDQSDTISQAVEFFRYNNDFVIFKPPVTVSGALPPPAVS